MTTAAKLLCKILIYLFWMNLTFCLPQSNKLQQCNQTSRGVHVLYSNKKGNDVEVVCLKKDKEYRWRLMDGSSTYGEQFNPANDCSDIVDNLPNPENGFYWVTRNTTNPRKVWCDVDTDGGGFMLVGMKDSPESWTVPSSSTPVHPNGPQHWSSVLGNTEVQDFGIQFSSDGTFEGTEVHWFYHLKEKRQLRNLFTNDKSTGCTKNDPGIGDVMYVKDVRTGSTATNNFRCSIFGPHTHPNLGWARMNYCLDHDCKNGYGVIPGPFPFKYDHYGSFSYSAVSSSSGTERNSTAFVGCDDGKCCACFGPKGGRKSYCGPACTSVNGGTVLKQAIVWFWVRTRRPKRLWKRCMEFRMKNTTGKLENYFIDPKTGTVREGSCSRKFQSFLNEGTLTVLDKEGFERIPHVAGLLSYQIDNKQLYVNDGSEWKALSTVQERTQKLEGLNKKVSTLEQEGKALNKTLNHFLGKVWKALNDKILKNKMQLAELKSKFLNLSRDSVGKYGNPGKSCLDILRRREKAFSSNGEYWIVLDNKPTKVYCDMKADGGGWTLISNLVLKFPRGMDWSLTTDFRQIYKYDEKKLALSTRALGALGTKMPYKQLRFFCHKKVPGRTIDIATQINSLGRRVIQYFTAQTNTMPNSCGSYYRLSDDNSILARHCSQWGHDSRYFVGKWHHSGRPSNDRLFNHLAFVGYKVHWLLEGSSGRWECDDYKSAHGYATSANDFWKVFVR